jgi:hypothetical protein
LLVVPFANPVFSAHETDRASNDTDPQLDLSSATLIPAAIAATGATSPMPYMAAPMGYPAGFFGQYPAPPPTKPGEAPTYYPQYYFAPIPMPPPPPAGQEGSDAPPGYPAGFYPATFLAPYAPQAYHPGAALPYMVHAPPPPPPHHAQRVDGQSIAFAPPPPLQYAAYPQAYPKPQAAAVQQREGGQEIHQQVIDPNGRRVDGAYGGAVSNGHAKAG